MEIIRIFLQVAGNLVQRYKKTVADLEYENAKYGAMNKVPEKPFRLNFAKVKKSQSYKNLVSSPVLITKVNIFLVE